ncbi:unnamed protein product [Withania somnifera]
MCKKEFENPGHPFLHCEVASDLWSLFMCISGLKWVTPQSAREAYLSSCSRRVDKSFKYIWRMIPVCIFWSIWIERNRRCFYGVSTPISSLKAKCIASLFSWSNLSPINTADQLLDFISTLTLA